MTQAARTVASRCNMCNQAHRLSPSQLSIIAYDQESPSRIVWRCPFCDQPLSGPTNSFLTARLIALGVQVIRLRPELTVRPRIALDDLIDLGLELAEL